MKIAVDARELGGRLTGVGRYLAALLTEWSAMPDARVHDWILYAPEMVAAPEPFAGCVRQLGRSRGTAWEQWTLARALSRDAPDVLFAPGYTAPLSARRPVVQTIHDVSFFAHPEWFAFREGARRRTLTRLSAARARLVVTDSAFSRAEIVRHLDVAPDRVRLIPLGVAGAATPVTPEQTTREPLVLFVGSIFRRRHVDALIRAFAEQVSSRVAESRLEIVGENRAWPALDLQRVLAAIPPGARERISIRSYVDDRTLLALYARASVFAFPSEYEGFGLTPLEALRWGVAPVVLETPVASEIYGAAACYVPQTPALERTLGEAIARLLSSASARDDLLRHAPAILARYRWDRTAAATLAAIEEAGHA